MANQKLKLTDKVDTSAALVIIALFVAPVIWCAHTGLDFGRVVYGVFWAWVGFYVLAFVFCAIVGLIGGILGGGRK